MIEIIIFTLTTISSGLLIAFFSLKLNNITTNYCYGCLCTTIIYGPVIEEILKAMMIVTIIIGFSILNNLLYCIIATILISISFGLFELYNKTKNVRISSKMTISLFVHTIVSIVFICCFYFLQNSNPFYLKFFAIIPSIFLHSLSNIIVNELKKNNQTT